ncbi:MAG: phosphodiesterase [Planctomycetota bacterium]|nr:phosphodiesterase [Planctomycetota bacterium]
MSECIIQLTDLHLLSDVEACVREVPTWRTLKQVLDLLRQQEQQDYFLVITGDLAQDVERGAYERLEEWLRDWHGRYAVVPGNHDDRGVLSDVFTLPILSSQDAPDAVCFSHQLGDWRLIGLDTQVPGAVHGTLSERQRNWLLGELEQHSRQPTVLFTHHPPFSVASSWADGIGLTNGELFWQSVAGHPQLRAVVSGHVHQDFAATNDGVLCLTTPATSFQFTPGSSAAQFDLVAPGFRRLGLESEGIATEVTRLPELTFPPCMLTTD